MSTKLFTTLREEHEDIVQTSDGTTYTPYKLLSGLAAGTTSDDGYTAGTPVDLEVFDFEKENPFEVIPGDIAIGMLTGATGNATTAKLTVTISHSDDGETYSTLATISDLLVADLGEGASIYEAGLPKNTKRYLKVTLSNTGTTAFTAGKIFGRYVPYK